MRPLRPIMNKKSLPEYQIGDYNEEFNLQAHQEYLDNKEIYALYFGSPDDAVLIWEEGMELPKASEEMERAFNQEFSLPSK